MARATNTILYRFVALLCLLAIVFIAIPYAICAPTPTHSMANMPAGHCDPCCPAKASVDVSCCTAHPQPSEAVPQPAQLASILQTRDLPLVPLQRIATPQLLRITTLGTPPPLLITNLRI